MSNYYEKYETALKIVVPFCGSSRIFFGYIRSIGYTPRDITKENPELLQNLAKEFVAQFTQFLITNEPKEINVPEIMSTLDENLFLRYFKHMEELTRKPCL